MSNYTEIGKGCWVHNDIGATVFPKKPPDWIADYLVQISTNAYAMGEEHARQELREALSGIGMATISDVKEDRS